MSDGSEIRLTEDEWADRFGWSVNEGNVSNLLEDSEDNVMMLTRIGVAYVWSQQDGEDGGYEIVPGMTSQAIGYYLCDRPRVTPADECVVGIVPPTDG
jgi:hypothetical protein